MTEEPPPVLALDIGSTKVEAMIAREGRDRIEVLGWAQVHSRGLRKGVVIHLEETTEAIREAAREAAHLAGVEAREAVISLAGGHIRGVNSRGVTAVHGADGAAPGEGEVSKEDIDRVIEAAAALSLPMDREIIHILPQEFILDGATGIRDPVGMRGTRLEAEVHIITGAVASAQNLIKAVNDAGLLVADIVLEPLAAAEAVLTQDEKDLGVILLNLGGGTTETAVFIEGALWQTEVISVGGENVTNDIAACLRTPFSEAEALKRRWGAARRDRIQEGEIVEIPSVGGRAARPLERAVLVEIIEARIKETFLLVGRQVARAGYETLASSGVVLTGGAASLPGIQETAEEILQMPVRMGQPMPLGGLADGATGPAHATVIGLVRHGLARAARGEDAEELERENLFEGVFERMRTWFKV